MMNRLGPALITLLLPWTALLSWLYAASLTKGSFATALLERSGVLAAGALVVGLPAVGVWYAEARWGTRVASKILLLVIGVLATLIAAAAQVLVPFGTALLMVAAAYGYGALAARWVDLDELRHTWQGAPLLAALGWAMLIVAGLAAGTAGLLTRPVVAGIYLIGIALAVPPVRRLPVLGPPPPQRVQGGPSIVWWWGLAALMLIGLVGAVAPEVRYDALAEHLPIARAFARAAAIVEMRENLASYFQLNGVLLYAMGMTLIPGAELPKLMHFLSGALAGLLVYSLGARLWGTRTGLAAAAIVAGTPLVWWVGETAYTDLWLVLFVTGAAECLVLFKPRPGPGRAFVTGLLAGAALGTKMTSVATILPFVAVALFWIGISRDRRARWLAVGALTAGWVLTGTYFYARAWILAGNPVFPLLNAYFKSPYAPLTNAPPSVTAFGMGRGLGDLLLIPWRVTRDPARFIEDSNIGVAYLALFPAALLAIVRNRIPRWLAGAVVAAGILWFLTGQYLRFLLPVLPLAALIGAAGLLVDPQPRRAALICGAVLLLGIAVTAGAWVASGPWNFPLSVVRRTVSRDEYAAVYVRDFEVARYARRTLPDSARMYGVGADLTFYYDRFFVPTSWHGNLFNRTLGAPVLNARTGDEVQTILLRAGFTHLVVRRDASGVAQYGRPDGWLARGAFGKEGPRLEYTSRGYYLFELQPAPR